MPDFNVSLRSIADTEAAVGWAENGHTVMIDRPDGRAGGKGLGFNGGQMLALAIGGCLCNDIRYVAHDLGIAVDSLSVDVTLRMEGAPLIATAAAIVVSIATVDPAADVATLLKRAEAISPVTASVRAGFPVTISAG